MCITRRQVLYRKPEPHPQGAAAGAKREAEGRGRGSESRRYSFWIHTPIPTHLILNSVIDPKGHGKAFFQISSSIKFVLKSSQGRRLSLCSFWIQRHTDTIPSSPPPDFELSAAAAANFRFHGLAGHPGSPRLVSQTLPHPLCFGLLHRVGDNTTFTAPHVCLRRHRSGPRACLSSMSMHS